MSDIDGAEACGGQEGQAAPGGAAREPWWRGAVEFVLAFAVMMAAIWGVRELVVEPFEIPSGSMLETIQIGDRVYAEKVSVRLDSMPVAGEVYTFVNPRDPSETLIKRVIATEGQTVDLRDGVVYVDGVALDEPYTLGKPSKPMTSDLSYKGAVLGVDAETGEAVLNETGARVSEQISYPYTVPVGYFWAMGDNRTNSADSRVFGAVSAENVTGRAVLRYWPLFRSLSAYEVDLGGASLASHPLLVAVGSLG